MINVLFLCNNMKYYIKLSNCLNMRNPDIRICGVSDNFKELVFLLAKQCVDKIIIDLDKLLDFSGLNDFLKNNNNYYNTHIVFLLNNLDNYNNIIENYDYVIKTSEIIDVVERINLLFIQEVVINFNNNSNEMIIKEKIINELKFLLYNFSHLGTIYILESIYILYTLKDYNYYNNLEKYIYPIVAKKYGKSSHNIKCNIRNATDIMLLENKQENIKVYLETDNLSKCKSKRVIKIILKKIN